ncbi:MAG: hypothetical protein SCH66_14500 [Methanolobus sp.]|nr:hypothetical protein [Methanolobus sp.]
MKFSEIEFGRVSAEYELTYSPKLILEGFLDAYGYIDEILNTEKFLVLGPKGSGKSTIGSKIRTISETEGNILARNYDLENFPYQLFSQVIPSKEAPETKYPENWEFILMVAAINCFIQGDDLKYPNTEDVKSVLISLKNLGLISNQKKISLEDIVKTATGKKVSVGGFGVSIEASKEAEKSFNPRKLYFALQDIFYSFILKKEHVIIIDGLDNVLTQRQKQYHSISALILAADKINRKCYLNEMNLKFVILCRTDLFDKLSDPNKNKIKQNSGIILDWYQDKVNLNSTNLAKLINLRAKISTGTEIDVFNDCLPADYFHRGQNKETIQVLFEYTRHTPRDIIQLFNHIKEHASNNQKPSKANIKNSLTSYSKEYFVHEINDELCGFLTEDEIKMTTQLLVKVGKYRFDITELQQIVNNDPAYKDIDINKIIYSLFNCNAIGNIAKNANFVTFKYRNSFAEFNPNDDILIHNGLQKGLNLK